MLSFLLSCFLLPIVVADAFWMTAELLRVDWREGCLTVAGCTQPRFKVLDNISAFRTHRQIHVQPRDNRTPRSVAGLTKPATKYHGSLLADCPTGCRPRHNLKPRQRYHWNHRHHLPFHRHPSLQLYTLFDLAVLLRQHIYINRYHPILLFHQAMTLN
ncbi:hypothetical protein GCK32_013012 [Trichostrongylus colubriformis]|uniref:C2 domain-containing protein n=1 Tax=Trichostrongylus colubriformis TaxID=6319 RepID=A0AAN8J133_TRICO